jgi:hypothetical protein
LIGVIIAPFSGDGCGEGEAPARGRFPRVQGKFPYPHDAFGVEKVPGFQLFCLGIGRPFGIRLKRGIADKVKMQMGDFLSCSSVEDQAVAGFFQIISANDLLDQIKEVREQEGMFLRKICQPLDLLFGDDQEVKGIAGGGVMESQPGFGFLNPI